MKRVNGSLHIFHTKKRASDDRKKFWFLFVGDVILQKHVMIERNPDTEIMRSDLC